MKLHTDLCNKKKIKVRFTDLTYQVQAWAKDEVKKSKKMERKNWKSVEWGELEKFSYPLFYFLSKIKKKKF